MKRVIFCMLALTIFSCTKQEKSNLPYARVNFTVDLRYEDSDLVGSTKSKVFTEARKAGERVGLSGILVTCGFDNTYYAYELCCPYEAKTHIRIEPTEDGTAVCPECKTVYDTGFGNGVPLEGPIKHKQVLRKFDVITRGQELFIQY